MSKETQVKPVFFIEDLNISHLFKFLLPEFERIFGKETFSNEQCMIYNNPFALCPMLEHGSPLKIRLSQEKTTYWAQTIFQLSHELCHYAIRQFKLDKTKTLSWYEEIVCEALSLYALRWSAVNWKMCTLSKCNSTFNIAIQKYLNAELRDAVTSEFSQCITYKLLQKYENEGMPENCRSSHRKERNFLFSKMLCNLQDCKSLCYYQNYLNPDGLTFDFEKWMQDHNNQLIDAIREIQPLSLRI